MAEPAGHTEGSDVPADPSKSPRTPPSPSMDLPDLLPECGINSHGEFASGELSEKAAEEVSPQDNLGSSAEIQQDPNCALFIAPSRCMELHESDMLFDEIRRYSVTVVGKEGQASMSMQPEEVTGGYLFFQALIILMSNISSTTTIGYICTL